jgi:hypothetical protein
MDGEIVVQPTMHVNHVMPAFSGRPRADTSLVLHQTGALFRSVDRASSLVSWPLMMDHA